MEKQQIRKIIRQELPVILNQDIEFRDWVSDLMQSYYAKKGETESRFDRMLEELRLDREANQRELRAMREEQNRKWEEQNRKWEEQNRKWEENQKKIEAIREEQNRKWEENQKKIEAIREEQNRKWEENTERLDKILNKMGVMEQRYNNSISALGARWGLRTEHSFRNGLKGILEQSFGVEVINVVDFDDDGDVFGRPEQVEIDVIIINGVLILCELKSSMSKPDIYIFDRKVSFYQKRHKRKADRKLVISPMVDPKAEEAAEKLGIEVYSYADQVAADKNVKKVAKKAKK